MYSDNDLNRGVVGGTLNKRVREIKSRERVEGNTERGESIEIHPPYPVPPLALLNKEMTTMEKKSELQKSSGIMTVEEFEHRLDVERQGRYIEHMVQLTSALLINKFVPGEVTPTNAVVDAEIILSKIHERSNRFIDRPQGDPDQLTMKIPPVVVAATIEKGPSLAAGIPADCCGRDHV
jgi:hypothetical protein